MRRQIVVTSGNTPFTVPVDNRNKSPGAVVATPSGSGNYTVAYTVDNIYDDSITPTYIDITDMTTATASAGKAFGTGVTALKITLHSGTDVTVSVSQA